MNTSSGGVTNRPRSECSRALARAPLGSNPTHEAAEKRRSSFAPTSGAAGNIRAVTCAMLTLAAAFSAFGAKADAIVLGTATDSTICSRSGPGSDRNCTWTYGALAEDASGNPLASNRALFKVAAQASADRSNSDASTSNAKADLAVSLILPYTVTRTVTVAPSPGGGYVATVPIQRLSLGFPIPACRARSAICLQEWKRHP